MATRGEQEQIERYRKHNVTVERSNPGFGVVHQKPNPHETQCQCDDCRDVRRKFPVSAASDRKSESF